MTWTRVKRWCGTHAVLAVNLVTVVAYTLAAVGVVAIRDAWGPWRTSQSHEGILIIAIVCVTLMVVTTATHTITVIVIRAGLPMTLPLGCLKYPLLITVLFYFTLAILTKDLNSRSVDTGLFIGGIVLVPVTMLAQLMGWVAAVLFGRRKVRSGTWEFTRPPSAGWERPTFPVRHPAATVVMVATAMGFVLGLLNSGFGGGIGRANPLAWGLLFVYVPLAASMFGCGFFVTYRRRRFDLSSWPVMVGCLLSVVTSAAMIAGTARLCSPSLSGRLDWNLVLKFLAIEVAIGTTAGVAGYLGSELCYRRAVRRGAWEFARTGKDEPASDPTL